MEQNHMIRQILNSWVYALPIDEQSGESIVTTGEIDRLVDELTTRLEPAGNHHGTKTWLSNYISRICSELRSKFETFEESMFLSH